MIEVLKHGNSDRYTYNCMNCGCEFTYNGSDVFVLGAKAKSGDLVKGLRCPECLKVYSFEEFETEEIKNEVME
jgi:hypothetical protein